MSIRITTLDNGVRVVSDTVPTVESVSVGIWVNAGARHEAAPQNGIAHLLEHMVFKGTARRSALDIAREIETVGGQMNAYTGREHTAFYAKVLKDDLALALDLLSDLVTGSVLDAAELARERQVVIQEIGQATDTPDDLIFDMLQGLAFPDQPIGRPILGTETTVQEMSRDDLLAYRASHYGGRSMVVGAAGNLEHDALVDLVDHWLGHTGATADRGPDPGCFAGGLEPRPRELEQVHLALAFPAVSYHHPDHYAVSVLSTLFGGGMSSRLFQEVREQRGLAYSIYTFANVFTDTGILGLYVGTGAEMAGELARVLVDEIGRLGDTIEPLEVARAKAQLRAQMLFGLESMSARAEHLAATTLMFGEPVAHTHLVERIEAVTADDVARIARTITAEKAAVTAIGPGSGLDALAPLAPLAA
ncbi:MAG: insulinase family protein [Rhodospirillaceae bacterium]|nr:insulinase family protein [Rhodospirillaceae bacterium]